MNALQDIKLIPPQSEKKASHYFCNQKCDLIFAVMAAAAVAIGALIILGTLPGGVIAGYAVTGVGSFLFLISSVDFVRHCCSNSIQKPLLVKEIPLLPKVVESISEVASSSPKRKSLSILVREVLPSPIMVSSPIPLTKQEDQPEELEIESDEESDSFLFDRSPRSPLNFDDESYFLFPEEENPSQQLSSISDRLTAIEKFLIHSRSKENQSLEEDFENQSLGLEGIEQGLSEVEELLSSVEGH